MTTIDFRSSSRLGLAGRVRNAVVVLAARFTAADNNFEMQSMRSAPAYERFFGHFGLTAGNARSAIVAQLFDEPPVRARAMAGRHQQGYRP